MKNLFKSQKGSSFAYILVVVSILLILSGSLITMTVANYKLGLIKGGRNTAFYFADGAIDEALAEIEELSHRAEIAASEEIQKEDADFKDTTEWKAFEKWLEDNQLEEPEDEIGDDSDDAEKGTSEKEDEDKTYLSADEASELYSEALNREFQKQYLLYLMDNGRVKTNYTLIEDDAFNSTNDMELEFDGELKADYLSALTTIKFNPKGTEGFEEIKDLTIAVTPEYRSNDFAVRLTIQTSGAFNIYNKAVEVVVDMVPPKYDYVTVSSVVRKEMKTNDILENAITANEDVIIVGGKVSAQGDVYALGTFKDETSVTHDEKGGVIIGYNTTENDYLKLDSTKSVDTALKLNGINLNTSGSLEVTGNIKTVASVKPSADDSLINVSDSIYADSFIINEYSDDTKTTIGNNLFLMDDFLVKGKKSAITLGDSDFTLSAGNDNWTIDDAILTYLDGVDVSVQESGEGTSASVLTNPDLSSSIRVNKAATDTSIASDFVYVPGVAYIDVHRTVQQDGKDVEKFFQTGESFTAENNFFFYQNELEEQEERTQEVYYSDGDNSFGLIEYVDESGEIQDSPDYKAEHFLNTVREEYSKPDGVRDMDIVPEDDKTIMTIRSMERTIEDGEDDTADYNDNYAKGVILGNGRIYNPRKMDDSAEFSDIKLPSNITSDLQMSLLGFRDYREGELVTYLDEDDGKSNMLDQYIDFAEGKSFETINRDGLLVVVSDTDDVYINVPSTQIPGGNRVVYDGTKDIRGLVATKGDIYVYNTGSEALKFRGSLIAGGSIIFYGDGEKVIDNLDESIALKTPEVVTGKGIPIQSRAHVYETVGASDTLISTFHALEGRKLIVEKYKDTKNYTRSIYFNLDLGIADKDYAYDDGEMKDGVYTRKPQLSVGTVDIDMMSTPQLDGSSKEKDIKGYELVYWREI